MWTFGESNSVEVVIVFVFIFVGDDQGFEIILVVVCAGGLEA